MSAMIAKTAMNSSNYSFTTASTEAQPTPPAKVRETLGNTATEEGGPIEL